MHESSERSQARGSQLALKPKAGVTKSSNMSRRSALKYLFNLTLCHFRSRKYRDFIELQGHNIRFVMPRNLLLVTITKGKQKNHRFAACCVLLSTEGTMSTINTSFPRKMANCSNVNRMRETSDDIIIGGPKGAPGTRAPLPFHAVLAKKLPNNRLAQLL